MIDPESVRVRFEGEVFSWRGPSPYHFVEMPAFACEELRMLAPIVSYGWGVIPVRVKIGDTEFDTSLFPKNGGYLVPVKDVVRKAEAIGPGDPVVVELTIRS